MLPTTQSPLSIPIPQASPTGGRPAALYRFRSQILEERPAPGLRFGGRAGS